MKPLEPGESWGSKTKEDILADIKQAKAALAVSVVGPRPSDLRILRDPHLPPGTMIVSDDVFKMLTTVTTV